MKLTVLVDNHTLIDRYFYGEPGVSYYIEEGNLKLLFDVGYSDVFLKNAQKMRINLNQIDAIVISHGHNDHIGGLFYLIQQYTESLTEHGEYSKPKLIAHPSAFDDKYDGGEDIGSLIKLDKLAKHFSLHLSKSVLWLTDRLVFLGEIERRNDFEGKNSIGKCISNNSETDDFIIDDSALVYKAAEGLFIMTGCSHSGICNTVEYAKQICQDDRIAGIIGGFHLQKPAPELLQKTGAYFANNRVKALYPCHCTDLQSKIALAEYAAMKEVGVGLVIEYS